MKIFLPKPFGNSAREGKKPIQQDPCGQTEPAKPSWLWGVKAPPCLVQFWGENAFPVARTSIGAGNCAWKMSPAEPDTLLVGGNVCLEMAADSQTPADPGGRGRWFRSHVQAALCLLLGITTSFIPANSSQLPPSWAENAFSISILCQSNHEPDSNLSPNRG